MSKANGLNIIIEHTGINKALFSGIGDVLYDIPMLEKFNGYTVNNAKVVSIKI